MCLILLFSISKKGFVVITKGYCQDQIKCLQGDEVELAYYIIVSKYIFSLYCSCFYLENQSYMSLWG